MSASAWNTKCEKKYGFEINLIIPPTTRTSLSSSGSGEPAARHEID